MWPWCKNATFDKHAKDSDEVVPIETSNDTTEFLLLPQDDHEGAVLSSQESLDLNLDNIPLINSEEVTDSCDIESIKPYMKIKQTSPLLNITFNNVKYRVKGKNVLDGISGYIPACKLLAILGPSGAGKSTLLDILASRTKQGNVTGKVLAHYIDRREPTDMLQSGISNLDIGGNFQQLSGYITQEDTFISNLTVMETMKFAQALRGKKEDDLEVDHILETLRLTKVKHTRVGDKLNRGISGGEARRLSIAVGLLISPGILFIDEPTTNLDSSAALKVMQTLRELCNSGYTIVCSVHQPRSNIYDMFDFLLLLDSGKQLYFGHARAAVKYFRDRLGRDCPLFYNPAEFMLDMLEEEDAGVSRENHQLDVPELCLDAPNNDSLLEEANTQNFPRNEIINMENNEVIAVAQLVQSVQPQLMPKPMITNTTLLKPIDHTFINENGQGHITTVDRPNIFEFTLCWKQSPENKDMNLVLGSLNALSDVNIEGNRTTRRGWLTSALPKHRAQIRFCRQLWILLRRSWVDKRRNNIQMYLRIIGALTISFFLGVVFFRTADTWKVAWNRVNTINFSVTVFILFSLPSISKFIEDRLIFFRERESGCYCTLAYYLAVVSVETFILLIMTLSYGSICYWMVGMDSHPTNFFYFLTVLFLVINISCAFCQSIAAVMKSVSMGVSAYMICVAYMLLFGGFIIQADQMPSWIRWIVHSSFYFHSAQGLFVNEFENRIYGKNVQKWLGVVYPYNKGYYLEVLIIYFIVIRIISFLLLNYCNKERR